MTVRAKRADPFDVWGKPPQIILDQLGRKDHDHLRRYVQRVTTKAYLIGRDCGVPRTIVGRLRAALAVEQKAED
jgi:hypothetical protein